MLMKRWYHRYIFIFWITFYTFNLNLYAENSSGYFLSDGIILEDDFFSKSLGEEIDLKDSYSIEGEVISFYRINGIKVIELDAITGKYSYFDKEGRIFKQEFIPRTLTKKHANKAIENTQFQRNIFGMPGVAVGTSFGELKYTYVVYYDDLLRNKETAYYNKEGKLSVIEVHKYQDNYLLKNTILVTVNGNVLLESFYSYDDNKLVQVKTLYYGDNRVEIENLYYSKRGNGSLSKRENKVYYLKNDIYATSKGLVESNSSKSFDLFYSEKNLKSLKEASEKIDFHESDYEYKDESILVNRVDHISYSMFEDERVNEEKTIDWYSYDKSERMVSKKTSKENEIVEVLEYSYSN